MSNSNMEECSPKKVRKIGKNGYTLFSLGFSLRQESLTRTSRWSPESIWEDTRECQVLAPPCEPLASVFPLPQHGGHGPWANPQRFPWLASCSWGSCGPGSGNHRHPWPRATKGPPQGPDGTPFGGGEYGHESKFIVNLLVNLLVI